MTRWPLLNFPPVLSLDGCNYQKVPSRPGAVAEYEELRGTRRVFVIWKDGRFMYNYDEHRQSHTFRI